MYIVARVALSTTMLLAVRQASQMTTAEEDAFDCGARPLKIVIIGDAGVGKSEFTVAACDESISLPNRPRDVLRDPMQLESTIGVDFQTTSRRTRDESRVIRFQLWDTAGSERFRSLTTNYMRFAVAFLVFYEVVSFVSFQNAIRNWLHVAQDFAQDEPLIFVVGSKTDLVPAGVVDVETPRRRGGMQRVREVPVDAKRAALERWPEEAERLNAVTAFYETNVREENGYVAYDTFTKIAHVVNDYIEARSKAAKFVIAPDDLVAIGALKFPRTKKKKKC
jgi:small GTP-binding protein